MIRFADGDKRIIFRGNNPDSETTALIAMGAAKTSGRVVEIIEPEEQEEEGCQAEDLKLK
jgi:hypothetical protein